MKKWRDRKERKRDYRRIKREREREVEIDFRIFIWFCISFRHIIIFM